MVTVNVLYYTDVHQIDIIVVFLLQPSHLGGGGGGGGGGLKQSVFFLNGKIIRIL